MASTSATALNTEIGACREVTPKEVAHYDEFGWVKLERFIDPALLEKLFADAKQLMGEDADSNPVYGVDQQYLNAQAAAGWSDPQLRPMFGGIGEAAKRFMHRKADVGVRLMTEFFGPKLPAGKKTRNMGNGVTDYHQDYINLAVDRTGGMTFWFALEAYGPEFGTMSFFNRSHRLGAVFGKVLYEPGKFIDIRDAWPELNDCAESEQITYELGDVTVHNHLTVHGATANMTDRPRWAYQVLVLPADARWNGAPPEAFDPVANNMTAYGAFPDEGFPVLAK